MDFVILSDHKVKLKEKETRDKYLELARKLKKKTMKVTVMPIVIGASGTVPQMIVTRTRGLGNKRTSGDHPNNSIIEIGHNTEKSSGDSRRLAVTQAPVEDHQLSLV